MHRDKFITLHDHKHDADTGKWAREERTYALVDVEQVEALVRVLLDTPGAVLDVLEDGDLKDAVQEVADYFDQFVEWEEVKNG